MRLNIVFPHLLAAGIALLAGQACTWKGGNPDIQGKAVSLTLLQTADMHSRIFPYDMDVGEVDKRLGLNEANAPFGGGARLSYLVKREKARAGRVLYLDCGDPFQGAPVFNFYEGEAEFRVMSEAGLDAMVLGNHEFDRGVENLSKQLDDWARFPVLAANYSFRLSTVPGVNDLGRLVKPFVIFNLEGIKVGVIGVGDTTTMSSILESGNKYGITPLNLFETVQFYVNLLRPQVNVIVLISHVGLRLDEDLIRKTSGIDVVLGGHLHIVLNPPKSIPDCSALYDAQGNHVDVFGAPCSSRQVLLSHSGGFAKYMGRLDLVLRQDPGDANNWEVSSSEYRLFPIDSTLPEDPVVADMLLPYQWTMERLLNKDQLIGYAPATVTRFGSGGGDSQLGNLVATAMWLRTGIETDLAFTNTTGIRSDLPAGPVTVEKIFNIFPFDNTITTMFLSGDELIELFDYASHRTAIRGCQSQVQVAGMSMVLRCGNCSNGEFGCIDITQGPAGEEQRELYIGGARVEQFGVYEIATNNYVAQGGSGYYMLRRNTSQTDSGIPQRDALLDYIRTGHACTPPTPCATTDDCPEGAVCACNGQWVVDEAAAACPDTGACGDEGKVCVHERCVGDVALFYAEKEAAGEEGGSADWKDTCSWMNWAMSECTKLACVGVTGVGGCRSNDDCGAVIGCGAGSTCCKAPGATQDQTGACACADACDTVVATGNQDGRIKIVMD